ncbi:DUF6993 domain-containing protein [Renibacterium salmoninarum]|uniref:DUF6993 domain-containing protein n=1 Tax=Renibacterium salmoninarum TaxID=1646 RepID=UPI001F327697|nr:hypothetical protein [Renibacterium salmoninarum]
MSGKQGMKAMTVKGLTAGGLWLLAVLLSACANSSGQPAVSSLSASATATPAASDAASEAVAAMFGKVQSALGALAAQSPKPSQEQIRTALQGLTTAPTDVEVSISKTPTGLDVDAIQGSVKIDKSCVIGQVRDGQVAMTTQPTLATGLCFVGDQR